MYDHKEPLALKQEYKTFVLVCVYNRLTILDLDDDDLEILTVLTLDRS